MPEIKSDSYQFHSEFKDDGFRIILNLSNNLSEINLKNLSSDTSRTVSNIDVDVIDDNFEEGDIEKVIERIEKAHDKEKYVFFKVLKKEFIETLNPIY